MSHFDLRRFRRSAVFRALALSILASGLARYSTGATIDVGGASYMR